MCHSRGNSRKINRLHKRYLRIIGNNKQLSFYELLGKDCSVSIHIGNLQVLAAEMNKVSNKLSAPIIKYIFPRNKNPYTLRHNSLFSRRLLKSVYHGTETLYLKPWTKNLEFGTK